ncbi:MAG: imidazoleglycerol-phosphate dehydratase HisB [Planctomycetota bacterium]|jgi:imidazoleglycerol-phosphate dehydratase
MAERKAELKRKTNETDISIQLNLDGVGSYDIDTGVGFFDHMLTHLSKHSKIDMVVKAIGDLEIDAHHTVEDVGICIGEALCAALADKKGIARYGHSIVPMEDAKAEVTVDLSGRPFIVFRADFPTEKIGEFDVELAEEFLRSFSTVGKFNLHVDVPYGTNSHHIAEAIFKAMGQALGAAVKIVGDDIPSTKGVL